MDFDFDSDDDEPVVTPDPLTAQEMVDLFARKAKPRLLELLKVKVPHIFDDSPGRDNSTFVTDYGEVRLKLQRTSQPYGDMDRFAREDKVIGFVVNPGLLPIVKSMTFASQGRKVLVTRKIAAGLSDRGAVAHIEGFGIRILLTFDAEKNESQVAWEWLFGTV